jgi:hypothetical protein
VAFFGSVELVVDRYAKKRQDMIEFTGTLLADVGITRPTAFSRAADSAVQ